MKLFATLIAVGALCLPSCSDKPEQNDTSFWPWFESREAELAHLFSYKVGAMAQRDPDLQEEIQKTVEEVGDKLREEHPEFSPFFGYEGGANSLIITVHGQPEYFDAVDAFVATAPNINGWTFIALKPPSPFSPTTEIQAGDFQLKASEWHYSKSMNNDGSYDFVFHIPNEVAKDPEGFERLFYQIATDALGERFASTAVSGIEVVQWTENPPEGLLPFTDIHADISDSLSGK